MSKFWKLIICLLLLISVTIWLAVITYPTKNLRIITCDVGQGDAILLTLGKTQLLVDGGPDRKVLDCLSKFIPFWDRTIETVILTHPQKDHFGGLIEVFKRYTVELFIANDLDSGNEDYRVLKTTVGGTAVRVIHPHEGQKVMLGLMQLDILNPSREILKSETSCKNEKSDIKTLDRCTSEKDSNIFSVIAMLHYKNFDALFTGDAGPEEFDYLLRENKITDIEFLKVPHHGSKNGLTKSLLEVSTPEVAAISSGKGNSYGHPHNEVLELLTERNIKILRTDELGSVVVESDGEKVWVRW